MVVTAASLAPLLLPLLHTTIGSPLSQAQSPLLASPSCDCTGTTPSNSSSADYYICRDSRLGPVTMPSKFPLLGVVNSYDRLAGMTPGDFLAKWTKDGRWIWPPHDGYLLDTSGKSILGNTTLKVGTILDRFGGTQGRYLAAAEAPFDQRSLPPNSLNEDPAFPDWPFAYHVYEVVKPFEVLAGPVAGWFGQPGLGVQFWLGYDRNVQYLIDRGFIVEDSKKRLPEPGDHRGRCG